MLYLSGSMLIVYFYVRFFDSKYNNVKSVLLALITIMLYQTYLHDHSLIWILSCVIWAYTAIQFGKIYENQNQE